MAEHSTIEAIQEQPDYHEGFFDAMDGAPLFEDCSPIYAAGWRAWWEVKDILNDVFGTPDEAKLPADPFYSPIARLTRH